MPNENKVDPNTKKVESLESEVKLLKGEIKLGLTEVHDYLVNLKIAPPVIEGGLEGGDDSRISIDGNMSMIPEMPQAQPSSQPEGNSAVQGSEDYQSPAPVGSTAPARTTAPAPIITTGMSAPPNKVPDMPFTISTDTPEQPTLPSSPPVRAVAPVANMPGQNEEKAGKAGAEKTNMEKTEMEKTNSDKVNSTIIKSSRVNLLANLVRWVSIARREIGVDQLTTFLDVYSYTETLSDELRELILKLAKVINDRDAAASSRNIREEQLDTFLEIQSIGGKLTPELKECIMRFIKLTTGSKEETRDTAETWSWLLLDLHGILTGGGPQVHSFSSNGHNGSSKSDALKQPVVAAAAPKIMEKATSLVEAMSNQSQDSPNKENKPYKVKFTLPSADGSEKEFYVV